MFRRPIVLFLVMASSRPTVRSRSFPGARAGPTCGPATRPEFHLPEAVEREIEIRGFWAHTFGEGAPVSHPGAQARKPRGMRQSKV